jgi:PPOX class probable F420-dependent enzyme
VPGGTCARLDELPEGLKQVVDECRRATLSTKSADGTIAVVPVCFGLEGERIVMEIDDKPKGSKDLGRVRNIRRDPHVTLLFDRWHEDWTRLGWVMVKGIASLEPPGDASSLTRRYPQYEDNPPVGPLIVVEPHHVRWWTWE